MSHDVKVGDIFYSSWGYDQTNVDYAVVTKVTLKGVYIQGVQQSRQASLGHSDYVVPNLEPITGGWRPVEGGSVYDPDYVEPPKFHLVKQRLGDRAILNRTSYSSWYAWDGSPKYQTAPGYGH
jgi:hypothetical protein